MNIKVVDELHESLVEDAWALYHEAFRELNTLAVQRHLMYRSEFDDVMRDRRVQKYLCLDDNGELCGLSTYTNNLDAVPLISPQYFQRRWPEHYEQGRIWYIGFVAVNAKGRADHAIAEMIREMHAVAAAHYGIVGLDVCRVNNELRRLPRAVGMSVLRLGGPGSVQVERADEQSYWLYEFPAAA
ncbi:MAG: hypothetical protein AUI14_16390 [Actinobacteria bacterium 13_2_20CM_2_71_6]|nr:MAG: hypothetical protein AUI14_16390 [Actinobacteria bacterium 13_2_20CM_2_71_6]